MKKVLCVCYGSGHVRMVVPVAKALRDAGLARVQVLAFTTAAPVVREAGLDLLQVKDFTRADDAQTLARGRALA
ncbi:MAG: UDP-glycosyltransferase, partial [Ramlibacter sp.]|nr:UDP-glycosyltransferase [Ramlibacter sp.]